MGKKNYKGTGRTIKSLKLVRPPIRLAKQDAPMNSLGLTSAETLQQLIDPFGERRSLNKTEANYNEPVSDAANACGTCFFFQRWPFNLTSGGCTVVRGDINHVGNCDYRIDAEMETMHAIEQGAEYELLKHAKEPPEPSDTGANNAANNVRNSVAVQKEVKIVKASDDEQRLVYGVVLSPGDVDYHGDVTTAEEIEKACNLWPQTAGRVTDQHGPDANITIVQNYTSPVEWTAENGQLIKKGAWIQVGYIKDEKLWKQVKCGEKTGWSFGGTGFRL